MNTWHLLIISLPTENATLRMRIWRALKAAGAVVLRDGVYLLPGHDPCRERLASIATEVRAGNGSATVLRTEEPEEGGFVALFDRSDDYAALLSDVAQCREHLSAATSPETLKQCRKLRKAFGNLAAVDFFPGEAQRQAEAALSELELAIARIQSPDEPHATTAPIAVRSIGAYQGRTWATRRRPWVDRLACAWLIRRFIDHNAQLIWLEAPENCPPDAVGFDFDGASFSHVEGRVTFEVLLASFELEQAALKRLGALVHFLDVGGIQPPEAVGIKSVLAGLRDSILDDDQLLTSASAVFDSLLTTFSKAANSP